MATETQQRETTSLAPPAHSGRLPARSRSDGERSIRHEYLAKPRKYRYKQTPWISLGTRAQWCTQEMLTPVTDAARLAVATARLDELARPKTDRTEHPGRPIFYYSCGRASQITLVGDGAKTAACTGRIEALAKHKEPPQAYTDKCARDEFEYSCGRTSPIWGVANGAKSAESGARIEQLAAHKNFHAQYQPERPVPSEVSPVARAAACRERVEQLARPRSKKENQFREPRWEVSAKARKATASPRTVELSRYKPVCEGYHFNLDQGQGYDKVPRLIRPITRNVRNAVASSRIKEMSSPIIRQSMDLVQFNPEAFVIKKTALNASCPTRVNELAQPVVR